MDTPDVQITNPFEDQTMPDNAQPYSPAENSANASNDVSRDASRNASPSRRRREKKRVGFSGGENSGDQSADRSSRISWVDPSDAPMQQQMDSSSGDNTPFHLRAGSGGEQSTDRSHLPELSQQQTNQIYAALGGESPARPPPRPAMRRIEQTEAHLRDDEVEGPDELGDRAYRQARAREAFERGKRLEEDERSVPTSRYNSPDRAGRAERIPLQDLSNDGYDTTDDEGPEKPSIKRARTIEQQEAHRLVRKHTAMHHQFMDTPPSSTPGTRSGVTTPTEEQEYAHDYRPRPQQYRGGILGALLKLYNQDEETASMGRTKGKHRRNWSDSVGTTPQHSPPDSGTATPTGGSTSPKHWYSKRHHHGQSSSSLVQLVGSSAGLGSPVVSGLGEQVSNRLRERKQEEKRPKRPGLGKRQSSGALAALANLTHGRRIEEEIKITKHIAETMSRQKYLMRLCKALMIYGAPTHRLEEYMRMSARVLEIEAQFLYIPGSMIMSFDDTSTHTTEVKLVKVAQGLDLGKLRDTHEVYKDVVHDMIGVDEATVRLKEVMARPNKHSRWLRIPVYGLAAVCVGPFAFQARLIDLPVAFILGCILGVLQLVIAPASDLYANVFEISAAVITSFLARAFGSIPYKGERLFCFSALAQSSIALILPGYIVLCASLELQSKSIVAGSVRMVYAIIYSLFLGFGITIGTVIYGIIDVNASSDTTCKDPMPDYWYMFFVPGFAMCLIVINQAKWKQAPVMVVIAFAGYVVNFFSSQRFQGNTQVSNTLGALVIGVMANLYSRIGSTVENYCLDLWEQRYRPHWKNVQRRIFGHRTRKTPKKLEEGLANDGQSLYEARKRRVGYSLAAAAMLPAIFVQVPSGLAVNGSLVSGIASANQIAGNATNGTTVVNSTTLALSGSQLNNVAFNVSYSVIQVAIGITVGLFLSAIVVYPLGKRRSGLFSF